MTSAATLLDTMLAAVGAVAVAAVDALGCLC